MIMADAKGASHVTEEKACLLSSVVLRVKKRFPLFSFWQLAYESNIHNSGCLFKAIILPLPISVSQKKKKDGILMKRKSSNIPSWQFICCSEVTSLLLQAFTFTSISCHVKVANLAYGISTIRVLCEKEVKSYHVLKDNKINLFCILNVSYTYFFSQNSN